MTKTKGSITVYVCLTMIVVLSLITTGIRSATIASARVSMVSAADLGLYSLFGQYDKDMIDQFGLLFIDGGIGQADLQIGKIYQTLKEEIDYNLYADSYTNGLCPQITGGSVRGYTLATDGNGGVFKEQVVSYMKETIGAQGIEALMAAVAENSETVQQQEADKATIDSGDSEDYEAIKQAQAQAEAEQEATLAEGGEVAEVQGVDPNFVNPIDVIENMRKLGILNLVIANPEAISQKEIDTNKVVSKRPLQQGMGVVPASSESEGLTNNFLLQEYLLKRCGDFTRPKTTSALEYQMEYLLLGKDSDIDNLKGIANRLLLIREAANFLHLMTDPEKQAQATSIASVVALAIGMPQAEKVLEWILMGCWAFGESVIDVRALFRGEKVALIKSNSTWQLRLDQLANLPELLNGEMGGNDSGLDYQAFLRILLAFESEDTKLMRAMDVTEMTIQGLEGRENFRLDSCLYSIDVEMEMSIANNSYKVGRSYGYDM